MDSKLLAFRLARPVEPAGDPVDFSYDPQSQTATWGGNGAANAFLACSGAGSGSHYANCNAYGNYCNAGGGKGYWHCDFL
jgi:hypothetical protein